MHLLLGEVRPLGLFSDCSWTSLHGLHPRSNLRQTYCRSIQGSPCTPITPASPHQHRHVVPRSVQLSPQKLRPQPLLNLIPSLIPLLRLRLPPSPIPIQSHNLTPNPMVSSISYRTTTPTPGPSSRSLEGLDRQLGGEDTEALLDGHAVAGELVVGREARGVGRLGGLACRGGLLFGC
jgi:hypothetical protein